MISSSGPVELLRVAALVVDQFFEDKSRSRGFEECSACHVARTHPGRPFRAGCRIRPG